jgi:outer membrane receptor protein involved in Fe transport
MAIFGFTRRRSATIAVLLIAAAGPEAVGQTRTGEGRNAAAGISELEEVIVTATRSAEPLMKVPLSVQALTTEDLQKAGLKNFEDVIRLSPGLTFNPTFAGGTNVAIRGIGSNAGSATTGIYIDDVPIQTRNLGYSASALYPRLFDLERLEVLRGPQGTLFGSGSEGGAIRFVQRRPSLTAFDTYTIAEVSSTTGGTPSYELGAAGGGPIKEDALAFRVSAYYRRDGGWIDRLTGTSLTVVDPTGAHYGPSAILSSTGTQPDTNYQDASAFRLAFRLAPTAGLSIEPSMFYQSQRLHDANNTFLLAGSNPDGDHFAAPLFQQIPGHLNYTGSPDLSSGHNELFLPALQVEWHGSGLAFYSTTAYLVTRKDQTVDSTAAYLSSYNNIVYPSPGQKAPDHNVDRQNIFSQEFRVQSDNSDARFRWLGGVFFSHANQYSQEDIHPNFFDTIGSTYGYFGAPPLDNGPPFGPGSTDFQNNWGTPLLANSTSYFAWFDSVDKQLAAFGQLSFKPIDKLTLTAGVRVSRNSFDFSADLTGPENNLNAPFGSPCPVAKCIFNDPNGPWAPKFSSGTVSTSENAVTPKYTISYQANAMNLFYASAAKGFRPGGGQLKLPTVCDPQLILLGFVDAQGNASAPLTFKSDSVWDYEVGSKNQLFADTVIIDANAYVIKWKDVQTNIAVPVCGYSFTDNLGSATSKGVDVALQLRPAEHLIIGINGSYNKATFDQTISPGAHLSPPTPPLYVEGETLPFAGAPWNASVSLDYQRKIHAYEAYLHMDYSYTGIPGRTGVQQPGTSSYQPLVPLDPAIHQVNLRVGTYLGAVDLSLFVNNLFDTTPLLGMSQPRDPNGIGTASIWTASTLRPRTIGVTMSARF